MICSKCANYVEGYCIALLKLEVTPEYANQRMNGNEDKCCAFRKINIKTTT